MRLIDRDEIEARLSHIEANLSQLANAVKEIQDALVSSRRVSPYEKSLNSPSPIDVVKDSE